MCYHVATLVAPVCTSFMVLYGCKCHPLVSFLVENCTMFSVVMSLAQQCAARIPEASPPLRTSEASMDVNGLVEAEMKGNCGL